jgi:hypothetical protein
VTRGVRGAGEQGGLRARLGLEGGRRDGGDLGDPFVMFGEHVSG